MTRRAEKIVVPFGHQTEDSQINDRGAHEVVWYRIYAEPPACEEATHEHVLHFGAVDYEATVWVDGAQVRDTRAPSWLEARCSMLLRQVAHHVGGHVGFSVPFHASASSERTEIVVRAKDRPHDLTQVRLCVS